MIYYTLPLIVNLSNGELEPAAEKDWSPFGFELNGCHCDVYRRN